MESALSDPQEFSFKPALLRGARRYVLNGTLLECRNGEKVEWSADLGELQSLNFSDFRARGHLIWRLEVSAADVTHNIGLNAPVHGAASDPDVAQFIALADAIFETAEQTDGDMLVGYGARGFTRSALFGLGVLSALGGAGILLAAVFSGVSSDRIATASVGMLALIAMGVMLIHANHPWKKPLQLPVGTMRTVLEYLSGRLKD